MNTAYGAGWTCPECGCVCLGPSHSCGLTPEDSTIRSLCALVDALRARCEELEREVLTRGAIIREALGWVSEPRDRLSPRVALLKRMRACALLTPAPAPGVDRCGGCGAPWEGTARAHVPLCPVMWPSGPAPAPEPGQPEVQVSPSGEASSEADGRDACGPRVAGPAPEVNPPGSSGAKRVAMQKAAQEREKGGAK